MRNRDYLIKLLLKKKKERNAQRAAGQMTISNIFRVVTFSFKKEILKLVQRMGL